MLYLTAKTLHIVGIVSWLGSLLYLMRLCVYHAEAVSGPTEQRPTLCAQFELMQSRLLRIITTPTMVLTGIAGVTMLATLETIPTWLRIKLLLLVILFAYHHRCVLIVRAQARGDSTWSSERLRAWNEVGTLLMVAIVALAVFKDEMTPMLAISGLIGTAGALGAGIFAYRQIRHRRSQVET